MDATENEVSTAEQPGEQPTKRTYRTKKRAGTVVDIPERMTTITHPEYDHSFTSDVGKSSFLVATTSKQIRVQSSMLVMDDGARIEPFNTAKLEKYYIEDGLDRIDLPLINVIFSLVKSTMDQDPDVFLKRRDGSYKLTVTPIYLPALIQALNTHNGVTQEMVKQFRDRINQYHSVLGFIRGEHRTTGYPLMSIMGSEVDSMDDINTIHISSPYMAAVYRDLSEPRYREIKDAETVKNRQREIALPNYANLIKTRLYGQRNKRAIAITQEIVLLVVRAGPKGTPSIRLSTLLDRIPELSSYVDDPAIEMRDKNKVLNRAFKAAWEYIDKYTLLPAKYRNIKFPTDFKPNMRNLQAIIKITHDGLAENADEANAPKTATESL